MIPWYKLWLGLLLLPKKHGYPELIHWENSYKKRRVECDVRLLIQRFNHLNH